MSSLSVLSAKTYSCANRVRCSDGYVDSYAHVVFNMPTTFCLCNADSLLLKLHDSYCFVKLFSHYGTDARIRVQFIRPEPT